MSRNLTWYIEINAQFQFWIAITTINFSFNHNEISLSSIKNFSKVLSETIKFYSNALILIIFRHARRTKIYDIEWIESLFWFMVEIMHLYSLKFDLVYRNQSTISNSNSNNYH